MTLISPKCYKARDFNGNEDLIPASQVICKDYDVMKSDAYWISAWILDRKSITYSTKKEAWFDEDGRMLPSYSIHHHIPEKKEAINVEPLKDLMR